MAYAIIKTGGRQYRVEEGDTIDVDLLERAGQKMTFGDVLMHADGEKLHTAAPGAGRQRHWREVVEQRRTRKSSRSATAAAKVITAHRPSSEVDAGQVTESSWGQMKKFRERGAGRRIRLSTFNFSNGS
jgi:ribosomal protein L21